MSRKNQIVIIGDSGITPYKRQCYEIGRHIALRGDVLITGGRGGVMEAASQGAHENGGFVIGILPGHDISMSNPYCSVVIPSGIGFARNSMNVLSADIIIAIGGKAGTLSELAYAWQYGKTLILCSFAGGWSSELCDRPLDDRAGPAVFTAHSVEDVCGFLDRFFDDQP